MSPRDYRYRVQDMFHAISEIQTFTVGIQKSEFLKDRMRYHAVVRCLEVIGESSNFIPQALKDKYPEIGWREIKDFRNLLAHKYFSVDDEIVWSAVEIDLPPLKKVIQKILDSEQMS